MLPMFAKKKLVSVISAKRGKSDVSVAPEVEAPESEMDPGLKSAAEDILRAIESKSVMDLAKAIQDAFTICDSKEDESEEAAE